VRGLTVSTDECRHKDSASAFQRNTHGLDTRIIYPLVNFKICNFNPSQRMLRLCSAQTAVAMAHHHAAHPECLRKGLRYRSTLRLSPHAKVRRKASAKSGERRPRFFMSALLSTTILPVDVKA
jgi:hypothetical protein